MLSIFFHNMSLIISFMFIGIRLKKFIIRKTGNNFVFRWLLSVMTGLLSTVIMIEPFRYKEMIFDLRNVPIFLIAYTLGWKKGLLSIIIPSIYRFYLGGNTVWQGIILSLLLPVIVGHFFYDHKREDSFLVKIDVKKALTSYLVFSLIRSIIQFFVLDISLELWIKLTINVTLFSLASLFMMLFIIKDVNQSIILRKELEWKANYDIMTDLPDLHYFKERVKEVINCDKPVVIIMIDIDNFKDYNDVHGHPAGDRALKELAQIFKNSIRDRDLIARYGGEEFILAIPGISSKEEALFIAKRFRKRVEKYQFEGEEILPDKSLTISLGISSLFSDKSLDELIEEADQALYSSKAAGKNCITFFNNLAKAK